MVPGQELTHLYGDTILLWHYAIKLLSLEWSLIMEETIGKFRWDVYNLRFPT